jgi:hypothetical protein
MPTALRLSILPLVGIAFLVAAFLWSERELRLRFLGEAAEGHLVGMALQRGSHADLLAGIDTDLALTLASGERLTASYADGTLVSAALHPAGASPGGSPSARPLDATTLAAEFSAELSSALAVAASGDATAIRWALQREGRRPEDPRRVLRIEKTETVRGWFGLPSVPEVLGLRDGELHLDDTEHTGIVRIRAVFDFSDPAAVQANKGESLVEYAYNQNGRPMEPEKKNFYLQAEPYATEFRPVFAYEFGGRSVARLSHIGRHGGPTLALRLFEPCRVFVDPNQPELAVVTALPGAVAGAPLEWFSRLCEGTFAQWGATALIALAGLMFITVGLLFASLAIWPSRKIDPD